MSKNINIHEINHQEIQELEKFPYKTADIEQKFPIGEIKEFLKKSLKPLLKGELEKAFGEAETAMDKLVIDPIIGLIQKHADDATEDMKKYDFLLAAKELLQEHLQDIKDLQDTVPTKEIFVELLANPADEKFKLEPLMQLLVSKIATKAENGSDIEANLLWSIISVKDENSDGKIDIGELFGSVYENAIKPVLKVVVSIGYKILSNLIDKKFDGLSEEALQITLDALNQTLEDKFLTPKNAEPEEYKSDADNAYDLHIAISSDEDGGDVLLAGAI